MAETIKRQTERVMAVIRGGCLCGNIRYEYDAEPLMVAVCHCKNCQKQSGSAFTVNVGVRADSITMTGGSLKTFDDKGASTKSVLRKFCGDCGSFMGTEIKAAHNLCFVSVGTLDDPSWAIPTVEIWCESKAEWGESNDDIPKYMQNPPIA